MTEWYWSELYERQFDIYFEDKCNGCDCTVQEAVDSGTAGTTLDRTLFKDGAGKYLVFCDTCFHDACDGPWSCAECYCVYTEYKDEFFASQPDKKLAKQLWELYGSKETVEISNCSNAWCKNCAGCDEEDDDGT